MTEIMGILNLTPDSFSGDGLEGAVKNALHQISRMIEEGASIIDIGAESTRPGAEILTPAEEWDRLAPVLENLGDRVHAAVFSVDTRHAETAWRALALGVQIINDVSGGADPAMTALIKDYDAALVLMHSLTIPADPAVTIPTDASAVEVLLGWAKEKIGALEKQGITREQIIFDPGIGFGKTLTQSWDIIRNIAKFKPLGVPLLIGHSRKSFLCLFGEKPASERDLETLAVSRYLLTQEVDYLRVHDVKTHVLMMGAAS